MPYVTVGKENSGDIQIHASRPCMRAGMLPLKKFRFGAPGNITRSPAPHTNVPSCSPVITWTSILRFAQSRP